MKDFGRHVVFGPVQGGVGVGAPQPLDGQRVSIQPASFNRSTTLGRAAKITYAPTSDQMLQGIKETETVAFWQGDKVEAQAVSVDIGMVLPPLPKVASNLDARPYALIEWGLDGYRQSSVVVDVGLGRRFVLVANYVAVTVGTDPPAPGQQSPLLTIGAGIGTFAAPSQAPVTRTIYLDQVDLSGGSGPLQIPARAVQLMPILTSAPTASYDVEFFNYSGNNICGWQFTANPAVLSTPPTAPFVMPPDAYFFTISSTAGGPVNVRLPFQLSL